MTENKYIIDLEYADKSTFSSYISKELELAELEVANINETIEAIESAKIDCDKTDYILASCSGLICGILDVFLVGKPGSTPLGNVTDEWVGERVKDFAKRNGWSGGKTNSLSSAIEYIEKEFKVPYDQTGLGDAAKDVLGLDAYNHHFKSLGHNPTICGLFFSILDQFVDSSGRNSSHFVTDGQLVTVDVYDSGFELRGHNFVSKLFCGITNWFKHLISDVAGSKSSKGRGMGIPSPVLAWTNSIIAIKQSLNIDASSFDKTVNELSLNLFTQGFDARFQATQMIPVFINECVVRFFYLVRRLVKYISEHKKRENISIVALWKECKPFGNDSIKRMLFVAHGVFCAVDLVDASVRGAVLGPTEFFLRINIAGVGKFAISLGGEIKRGVNALEEKEEAQFLSRKRVIAQYYIESLKELSVIYDDRNLVDFVDDFQNSDLYFEAFQKSVKFAEKRNVPSEKILYNKERIDSYFLNEDE